MPTRLRITGLVRLAESVRAELASPLSLVQRDRVQARVSQAIEQVNQIAQEAGTRVDRLPAPSRRAVQFLQSIQWKELPVTGDATEPVPRHSVITWPGLSRFVDRIITQLAEPLSDGAVEGIRQSVEKMSRQMEGAIERRKLMPAELTAASRDLRGWLAFFARPENITAYVSARDRAKTALDPAAASQSRFPQPLKVHFRPMRGIFKIRGSPRGSILSLPTPMIAFDAAGFQILSSLIFTRTPHARQQTLGQMTAEGFQSIHAELESLSGIIENERGTSHDLAESFQRVNERYFGNTMPRPRLTWSRSFTGRKFGHYDWILDTVMVSRTLDHPEVPSYVVDFIVYHELLHKKHGLSWSNGRGYAHTAEFHREEKQFEKYRESEETLEKLARGMR